MLPWGRSLHASRSRTCTGRSVACRTERRLLLRLTALCPRSRAQVETWFVGSSSRLRAESTLLPRRGPLVVELHSPAKWGAGRSRSCASITSGTGR